MNPDTFQLTILQVAFKRFVDCISMIIDFELLKGFGRRLDDALFKSMGLGEDQSRQRCAAFLKENPDVVRRRELLSQDLERFESALADLQMLGADSGGPYSGYDTDGDIVPIKPAAIVLGETRSRPHSPAQSSANSSVPDPPLVNPAYRSTRDWMRSREVLVFENSS